MNKVTIPKEITGGDELVIISREEYDRLREVKKIPEFTPTAGEKRDLARARRNRKKGDYITLHDLKRKLVAAN